MAMSKHAVFICCLMGLYSFNYGVRTFLSIPVPFHPSSPERQTMTHDEMRDFTQQKHRNFSITLLGGESTNSTKIAQYFLPFNKTCLTAGEIGSEVVRDHEVDLIANYFNVCTGSARTAADTDLISDNIFKIINTWTFQSKLQFCPKHKYFGIGLVYHHHLSSQFDKGWWFELAMPIMCVKNDMGMCETIEVCGGPGGTDPQNAPSFFSNEANQYASQSMTAALCDANVLRYGKIDCREYRRTKWGVADLELRLGYTYFKEPSSHLSSYAGILVPTGNRPTGEFMFEKIIGYNGQAGFFFGTHGGLKVWAHDKNFLSFEFDTSATLFLDRLQVRSFDLYGKPWGRYIWVYPNNNVQTTLKPGINYFTKGVYVGHGSLRNINLAWVYTMSDFQGELGYHFYSRDREKICLANAWKNEVALAALWYSNNNFVEAGQRRVSRTSATINNYNEVSNDLEQFTSFPVDPNMTVGEVTARSGNLENNDIYLSINKCQLDLDSAANPSVVIHTLYGSLGYGWYDIVFPTFINIAGGYEFGDGPAVIDRWKLWFKIGVSF